MRRTNALHVEPIKAKTAKVIKKPARGGNKKKQAINKKLIMKSKEYGTVAKGIMLRRRDRCIEVKVIG